MTHGTTTNSGNGYLTEIHRGSKPEAFVPPMRLYTETGCKGRVFLEHGHPRTTRMGSATYIPQFARPFVVNPPLELFDADGRTFRLDLLENYTPGGSIRYWIDANYQPELYPGIDYIGDLLHLLRTSPNDNSAALESLQNTPALGDKSNPTPTQGHQQGFQQGFLNIHERNFEDGNWGAQGQSSGGIGMAPVGPSVYGLEAGNDASRVGNSGKLLL
ncbi:hypothetical protein MMC31_005011 [Peltigera leucophlebia]|nr:hypothetical protein [Peltigera leucophlebia]